jgi:hypothetical protein
MNYYFGQWIHLMMKEYLYQLVFIVDFKSHNVKFKTMKDILDIGAL